MLQFFFCSIVNNAKKFVAFLSLFLHPVKFLFSNIDIIFSYVRVACCWLTFAIAYVRYNGYALAHVSRRMCVSLASFLRDISRDSHIIHNIAKRKRESVSIKLLLWMFEWIRICWVYVLIITVTQQHSK